ncbi:coiled-coil domain-containing protein 17 isoform X2 [Vidua chalybeata]|uniref:coiled-coil domain-containing protein 17 isoform X2 n=1 Tax=Vidua chalybeata TaxID=81927 RepID=UPI0023A792B6|nr:coiled-coil domain-containing protein 17 isoform X2 [Vidua chalybeata]
MDCREPFWEKGQGLDNTCGKKGQKELFHLCVEVPLSLKSAKEQLSGSCRKARRARGTPGQPQGKHACQRALYNHRGTRGSRACLILFSVDCSGGSATFFPHSGARGKQWECPGLGVRPSLPSPASSIATVVSNTAAAATSRVLDMGTFLCPHCRLPFRSRPLLRVHLEKLCLGPTAPSSSCLHGGNPLPVEGAQGTARKPQDISVGVSQKTDNAEPRHHFVPRGVPPAVRGQRGPGRVRGAPLGDVLTPRERALLRTADPTCRRLPVEGEPPRQPLPLQGHQEPPQELLEAHERQVAEIRARTRQLEQQREGLCQQLATLGARAPLGPQPEQGQPEPSQGPRDQAGQVRTAQHRVTLHLDTLLPPAGPLAAEARALRLSYLRSGGHDPAILDQLLHLQLEATVLEKGTAGLRRGRRMEPPSTGTHGLDAALLAVELENRRLEDELLALKVRRERRADAGSRAAQRHTEELARLQAEVGMLRCHAEQTRPWLHPPVFPHLVAPPLPSTLAVPELFMEPPGPALGPGRPTAHVPPGLPLTPFVALEDPPPAQEPPAQDRAPQR